MFNRYTQLQYTLRSLILAGIKLSNSLIIVPAKINFERKEFRIIGEEKLKSVTVALGQPVLKFEDLLTEMAHHYWQL